MKRCPLKPLGFSIVYYKKSLLQMRYESRNDQKIKWPATYHLVGNAYITALCIFCFWWHGPDRLSASSVSASAREA